MSTRKPEFRCTVRSSAPLEARNGTYIQADDAFEAHSIMRQRYPELAAQGFDVQPWKDETGHPVTPPVAPTPPPALAAVTRMAADATDLDVVISVLRDHYGIDVLILPKMLDRLAVVSLANVVLDCPDDRLMPPVARGLARTVLDLFAAQPETPEGT